MARLLPTLLFLSASSVFAGSVTISDTTFADAHWSELEARDDGNTFSFSASQVSDGVGGFRRFTSHSWATGQVALAHVYDLGTFNPSVSGAITGLTYSFLGNYTGPGNPGAVGYQIGVYQAGKVFVGPYSVSASSSFSTFSGTNLAATSFVEIGGSANPDFSTSGSQMKFGYITQNGTGFPGSFGTTHAIDNWSVTVNFDESAVPEPASLGLAGVAVLAGAVLRRRRIIA